MTCLRLVFAGFLVALLLAASQHAWAQGSGLGQSAVTGTSDVATESAFAQAGGGSCPGGPEAAINFTLAKEGGYVNHPDDPGGSTNLGITQAFLNENRGAAGVGVTDVRNLSRDDAFKLYQLIYDRAGCGDLGQPLDLACLDTATNYGTGGWLSFRDDLQAAGYGAGSNAVEAAQELARLRGQARCEDSYAGTLTVGADGRFGCTNEAGARTWRATFLRGWLNRDQTLYRYVSGEDCTGSNAGLSGSGNGGAFGRTFGPEEIGDIQCWTCDLIKAMLTIAVPIGQDIFEALRDGLRDLIGIMAGLYFLWYGFSLVMPFGTMDRPTQSLNQVVLTLSVAMIVYLLLTSFDFYWKVYASTVTASIGISEQITKAGPGNFDDCAIPGDLPEDPDEQNAAVADAVACQVRNITDQIASGVRIGWATMAATVHYKINPLEVSLEIAILNLAQRILLMYGGFALVLIYGVGILMFTFVILDVVFRWVLITILSPLMIASLAFKPTRTFFAFLLKGLFESLVALLFMSAIATIGVALVSLGDVDQLVEQIKDGEVIGYALNRDVFWTSAIAGMIMVALLPQARNMASSLVGSGIAGPDVLAAGGVAAKVAKETAKAAAGATSK